MMKTVQLTDVACRMRHDFQRVWDDREPAHLKQLVATFKQFLVQFKRAFGQRQDKVTLCGFGALCKPPRAV